jgi:two-component sensor histidine kinase
MPEETFSADGAQALGAAELIISLERALDQKDMLLDEIQHRIRNSLSLVTSLLNLQASTAPEPAVRTALSDASGRVLAVARLHDRLNRMESLDQVRLDLCLADIADGVEGQAGRPAHVSLGRQMAPVMVAGSVAVPVGLIANELLTNAYKYAFPEGRPGKIHLSLARKGDRVLMVVADSGIGYPTAQQAPAGLGTRVTRALAEQIGGRLRRLGCGGCAQVLRFSPPAA